MNTSEQYNALPMTYYSNSSQPSTKFNDIKDVSLDSIQSRVIPRQVSTGLTRGEQQIRGTIAIVDGTGTKRLLMGYKKSFF